MMQNLPQAHVAVEHRSDIVRYVGFFCSRRVYLDWFVFGDPHGDYSFDSFHAISFFLNVGFVGGWLWPLSDPFHAAATTFGNSDKSVRPHFV